MATPAVSYLDYPIYSAASDGTFIVTSGGGGGKDYGIEDQLEAHTYSAETGKLVTVDSVAAGGVIDSLNYNNNVGLFCGCSDRECVLIKMDATWGLRIVYRFGGQQITKRLIVARFSPSGEYVIAGGEDKVIRVWRVVVEEAKGKATADQQQQEQPKITADLVAELRGHEGDVKDVSMSDDSQLVASCGADGRICLWRWREEGLALSQQIPNPKNTQKNLNVRCCRFLRNPPGVSACQKRLIAVASDSRGPSFLFGWAINADGAEAPAGRTNKKVDEPAPAAPAAGAPAAALKLQEVCSVCCDASSPCCQLAVSEDQQKVAIGLANGSCKVFDRRLVLLGKQAAHELPATGLCFLGDGQLLLSTSADYSVAVLDTEARSSWRLASCGSCCWLLVLLLFAAVAVVVLQHILYTGQQQYLLRQQALTTGNFEVTLRDILGERLQEQQQIEPLPDVAVPQQEHERIYQQQQPEHYGKNPHDEL